MEFVCYRKSYCDHKLFTKIITSTFQPTRANICNHAKYLFFFFFPNICHIQLEHNESFFDFNQNLLKESPRKSPRDTINSISYTFSLQLHHPLPSRQGQTSEYLHPTHCSYSRHETVYPANSQVRVPIC